jgi:uncharacterized protein YbjT (DUF2867 family)
VKIVVIGGTGLIGSKLVRNLTEQGHEAVAAAPSTGVNTYTGAGLPEVVSGADESPGAQIRTDPSRMDVFTDYVANIATWLQPSVRSLAPNRAITATSR